ncbi:GNAT family N-acetyltransferase [Actinomadura craniellae]|uniref:GNAT family N-acetyltransferase n=1 Tax=Actinomadura craniellae TaxID=2231787 RepID=A0A365GWR6_9ACTN|nr:GNAT family N-acetyltransferase [Actinomadura craniellae]RAY11208.1 GNAT family N-acetyltransferase [Actinomadura craniellae]
MFRTPRLLLRRWHDSDRAPFAAMNADPEVMKHFPAPLTRDESNALIERIEADIETRGFGLYALEMAGTGEFIGFTGLSVPRFQAHFTPAVEIGWRLSRAAWGRGYATEAARAALEIGFTRLGLDEIVSFTTPANVRSQAVMRRIHMARDESGDFDHPQVPVDSPLRRHVLWRITAGRWRALADHQTIVEPETPTGR